MDGTQTGAVTTDTPAAVTPATPTTEEAAK